MRKIVVALVIGVMVFGVVGSASAADYWPWGVRTTSGVRVQP